MRLRSVAPFVFIFCLVAVAQACAGISVEIDLQEQRAYLLQNGRAVVSSPISSGRYGHLTPAGDFTIIDKDMNHLSSIYGKIVDSRGETINADADVDMPRPPGAKFVPAPMHYFMRFHGGDGMHSGYLPGYAASHGCVRMPKDRAALFYANVEVGTPVHVFGRTPPRGMRTPQFVEDIKERTRAIPDFFRRQFQPGWRPGGR
ncbi:MAG: L,D-transpeptidase [Verrucomicrobiota bacterium]|nr:L,D-transpeptidase [Verrucomicrobiota bacterium]